MKKQWIGDLVARDGRPAHAQPASRIDSPAPPAQQAPPAPPPQPQPLLDQPPPGAPHTVRVTKHT